LKRKGCPGKKKEGKKKNQRSQLSCATGRERRPTLSVKVKKGQQSAKLPSVGADGKRKILTSAMKVWTSRKKGKSQKRKGGLHGPVVGQIKREGSHVFSEKRKI